MSLGFSPLQAPWRAESLPAPRKPVFLRSATALCGTRGARRVWKPRLAPPAYLHTRPVVWTAMPAPSRRTAPVLFPVLPPASWGRGLAAHRCPHSVAQLRGTEAQARDDTRGLSGQRLAQQEDEYRGAGGCPPLNAQGKPSPSCPVENCSCQSILSCWVGTGSPDPPTPRAHSQPGS